MQLRLNKFEDALKSYTRAADLAPGISGELTTVDSPYKILFETQDFGSILYHLYGKLDEVSYNQWTLYLKP